VNHERLNIFEDARKNMKGIAQAAVKNLSNTRRKLGPIRGQSKQLRNFETTNQRVRTHQKDNLCGTPTQITHPYT